MARSRLSVCILAIAAMSAAGPALAQFGSIFTDEPPRPPANVPGGPPDYRSGPPYYSDQPPPPPQQRPYYPSRNDPPPVVDPTYDDDSDAPPRPPRGVRSDQPPAEPLPAPMNLPPSSRPGAGGIQTQDLAPPPGTEAPPAAQPQPLPQPGQPQQGVAGTNPVQTLPGLPPGVRQPPGTPQPPGAQQPANAATQPSDDIVVEPPPQRIPNPTAVFSGLDKITGRTISFEVAVNETVQFGALQVTPRACYSRPPTESPNTDSFVEVDEVTLQGEVRRIFTGWMFAASPGLHAVEHPIYDVWLTDCKGGKNPAVADASSPDAGAATLPPPAAKPAARAPAPRRATPPQLQQPRAQQQPPQAQPPGLFPGLR
jgi:hypothetical protein